VADPTVIPVVVPEAAATIAAGPAVEAALASAADPHAAGLPIEPEPVTAEPIVPQAATLGAAGGATPVSSGNKPSGGLNPWIWIPALVILLGIVIAVFR
jgi:hypothetical protein